MADKPIIFSGPMIRALLDGRKTQTRRVLRGAWQEALDGHDLVKTFFAPPSVPAEGIANQWAQSGIWAEKHGPHGYNRYLGRAPFRPGDRLWAREAHYVWSAGYKDGSGKYISYRADDEGAPVGRWSPSIHMPRWASRLTLLVTDVRVQRLQEISTDDCLAEGIDRSWPDGTSSLALMAQGTAKAVFRDLWNSIHCPDAWDANPWVAAISFDVHRGNIDQMETQP